MPAFHMPSCRLIYSGSWVLFAISRSHAVHGARVQFPIIRRRAGVAFERPLAQEIDSSKGGIESTSHASSGHVDGQFLLIGNCPSPTAPQRDGDIADGSNTELTPNKIQRYQGAVNRKGVPPAESLSRYPTLETPGGIIRMLDYVGTMSFAMSGAAAAGIRGMNLLGCMVVGTVAAMGGGTTRDLLLGQTPVFWLNEVSQDHSVVFHAPREF